MHYKSIELVPKKDFDDDKIIETLWQFMVSLVRNGQIINSYICPECRQIIEYDKQVVIARIQKKLVKNILTDDEIQANWDEAFASVEKAKKIVKITEKALIIVIIAVCLYFSIKSK